MGELQTTTGGTAIEAALIRGDLSQLTTQERLNYYNAVCESVGLNPLTQPFAYLELNRKLVLYAKRDATDQLRKIHKVSITISAREKFDDVYVVTARAKDTTGREDESTGAVAIAGLKGDALANAYLKAETKAKRRVTLSICGLGLLDETETESIPGARVITDTPPNELAKTERRVMPQGGGVGGGASSATYGEVLIASDDLPKFVNDSEQEKKAPSVALSSKVGSGVGAPGDYVVPFGKKLKGKKLKEIPTDQIQFLVDWIRKDAKRPLSANMVECENSIADYLAGLPSDEWKQETIPF